MQNYCLWCHCNTRSVCMEAAGCMHGISMHACMGSACVHGLHGSGKLWIHHWSAAPLFCMMIYLYTSGVPIVPVQYTIISS
mmetsp:Transcript_967/g.1523  ORF Transcript_967/g.1523 Transcript_967/m.1523 type:complete len:81 (-) Transcript_967:791-1033(-)